MLDGGVKQESSICKVDNGIGRLEGGLTHREAFSGVVVLVSM